MAVATSQVHSTLCPRVGRRKLRHVGISTSDSDIQFAGIAAVFLQIEGQRAVARQGNVIGLPAARSFRGTQLGATAMVIVVHTRQEHFAKRSPTVIVQSVAVGRSCVYFF